jgi:hypothetical protein
VFWHSGRPLLFFNVGHSLISVTKVPAMQTYQNEHNMLLNFPRCPSILLLQTSKTDNNALDIDAIYNLKLRKTKPNSTDSFMYYQIKCKISMASHYLKTMVRLMLILNFCVLFFNFCNSVAEMLDKATKRTAKVTVNYHLSY